MIQTLAAYGIVLIAAGWLGWRWLPRGWRARLARQRSCSGGCGHCSD